MKKKMGLFMLMAAIVMVLACGCIDSMTTTVGSNSQSTSQNTDESQEDEKISLTYTADFYDNGGERWLSVKGKSFSIKPNKVKTYSWDSSGSWISAYEMSSIVSVNIDGNDIETCGSTVIFADDRLEKYTIPSDMAIVTEESLDAEIDLNVSHSSDMRFEDWYKLQWCWNNKILNNESSGAKVVIIQSQLGNPICMYVGNNVSWNIPKNLPKTTLVKIDGMPVYIHRANFAIIDSSLLN